MANSLFSIFGWEFKRRETTHGESDVAASPIPPENEDGAYEMDASGFYTYGMDFAGTHKNEQELIKTYRNLLNIPEVESCVNDIVDEAIVTDEDSAPVDINMDDLEVSDAIKEKIRTEFQNVLRLLDFNTKGSEIFKRWYVDARLNYHILLPKGDHVKKGIKELRYVSPLNIRKVREHIKERDKTTGQMITKGFEEYYVYHDEKYGTDIRVTADSIAFVHSGIWDEEEKAIKSHLHKAIRPANQLKMLEDSMVIYRLSRAPERRIFYIDVGNLPKQKAEQYLRNIMNKYRNKMVYDPNTGKVKDSSYQMSMMEDYWLPRREGGKGTEVSTLPGGQNLGDMEDVLYFQKKLYHSLNVPESRQPGDGGGNMLLGRASEISRDELKFNKFVQRLRKRFSMLFFRLLRTQLLLKKIITPGEWEVIEENIRFDFLKDNYYAEFKESEVLRERLSLVRDMDSYVGVYFSKEYVRRNILRMSDEDITEEEKRMEKEAKENEYTNDGEVVQQRGVNGGGMDMGGFGDEMPADDEPAPEAKPERKTAEVRRSGTKDEDEKAKKDAQKEEK